MIASFFKSGYLYSFVSLFFIVVTIIALRELRLIRLYLGLLTGQGEFKRELTKQDAERFKGPTNEF